MSSSKRNVYVRDPNLCDRNHFQILKGVSILAALIALFCQSFLEVGDSEPIVHIAATVFVLCSGFGVSESFVRKGSLIHYWENKLIKVWIPSLVIVVAFSYIKTRSIASWFEETPLGLKGDLLYLIFAGYGAFWLIFKKIGKNSSRIAALFLCAVAAFFCMPESSEVKPYLFAFPMGAFLSQTEWKRSMVRSSFGTKILVLVAWLLIAVGGGLLLNIITVPYISTMLASVCYLSAAMTLLLLTYYLQTTSLLNVFAPVGAASYAIYLIYEEVFHMFEGKTDPKMYIAMFAVIAVVAALLTWLRELLITWNRNLRRRNRVHLKGSME